MIRVVADENIHAIDLMLGRAVELRRMPGRLIDARAVREADALLVRSVTRVDAALLEGSRVRFVGSATAGLDHVDEAWLGNRGIAFASAPGSNAESVAEYIAAAILHAARFGGWDPAGRKIGIVGAGHCGSRVERVARALGMEPLVCDPPLARLRSRQRFVELGDLLAADVVTLHVPLTDEGSDGTRGMISESFIREMKPGAILMNASRGGVVDEVALIAALEQGRLGGAVIDAWVGEPRINCRLAELALLATPHIAGYSLDGKILGGRMVAEALATHFGLELEQSGTEGLAPPTERLTPGGGTATEILGSLVDRVYPIAGDSAALKSKLGSGRLGDAHRFDEMRKEYWKRREFAAYSVDVTGLDAGMVAAIRGLGFGVD